MTERSIWMKTKIIRISYKKCQLICLGNGRQKYRCEKNQCEVFKKKLKTYYVYENYVLDPNLHTQSSDPGQGLSCFSLPHQLKSCFRRPGDLDSYRGCGVRNYSRRGNLSKWWDGALAWIEVSSGNTKPPYDSTHLFLDQVHTKTEWTNQLCVLLCK